MANSVPDPNEILARALLDALLDAANDAFDDLPEGEAEERRINQTEDTVDANGVVIHHIYASDSNDNITGTSGVDHIHAYEGNDTIYGKSGDDSIKSGWGNELVCGGDGAVYFGGMIISAILAVIINCMAVMGRTQFMAVLRTTS